MQHLNLPQHLSTNALVTVLGALMDAPQLVQLCEQLFKNEETTDEA